MAFALSTGTRYRGSHVVTGEASAFAGASQVRKGLESVGFADVQVWDDWESLPKEWPDDDRKETKADWVSQFWAEGTWTGKDGQALVLDKRTELFWIRPISGTAPVPRHEVEVSGGSMPWIPPLVMVGMAAMMVGLVVKGSK
jgi:hypothetical protein